jgi:hypothetical protein
MGAGKVNKGFRLQVSLHGGSLKLQHIFACGDCSSSTAQASRGKNGSRLTTKILAGDPLIRGGRFGVQAFFVAKRCR